MVTKCASSARSVLLGRLIARSSTDSPMTPAAAPYHPAIDHPATAARDQFVTLGIIISGIDLSDLGMEHRQIHRRPLIVAATLRAKQPGCPVEQLRLPLGDLVGMNVELLCQLGQRLLALDGGQSHLRLESRGVVPAS